MLNGMHETLLVVDTRCFRVEMQSRCKSNSVNVYVVVVPLFLLARLALVGLEVLIGLKVYFL